MTTDGKQFAGYASFSKFSTVVECRRIFGKYQAGNVSGPGILLLAKGDILAFPRGATPVDFAYAVHSGVGDTCVGAKINGRIVPLRTTN